MLTMSFNAIGSLFQSVIKSVKFGYCREVSEYHLRCHVLAYTFPRLYSLHQPQYPTEEQDVINSIVQCLPSRNTFLHFSTSQKATRAAAYFCLFIKTGIEKRLPVTSPRTISMRYES